MQNIGSALNSYQKTELTLYFAAADGNGLAVETVNVRYNSNTSLQKLILEQLLKAGHRRARTRCRRTRCSWVFL